MAKEWSSDPSGFGPDAGSSRSHAKDRTDPLDFGATEDAVNEAAKRANAAWLALMAALAYFFVATVKITHKDLFLEKPVKLPLLNVEMPLAYFAVAAPSFVLLFHVFALLMTKGLREKIEAWNERLGDVARIASDRERLRRRLDTSVLAQAFGRRRGWLKALLIASAWATVVLAPLLVLALTEAIFLPYQHIDVTDGQRTLIVADGIAVAMFWSTGFLSFVRSLAVVAALIAPSWFVLVFPDKPRSNVPLVDSAVEDLPALRHFVAWWLTPEADLVHRRAAAWLSNRLVLPDQNLAAELGKDGAATGLRGRRLAAGIFDRSDLHGVDFTGADMRRASLVGVQLQDAAFRCADTGRTSSITIYYSPDTVGNEPAKVGRIDTRRHIEGCALLDGANLTSAHAARAVFDSAFLLGATLNGADLSGANFFNAQAQGASFQYTLLDATLFMWAGLDGATFEHAALDAADFTAAEMSGVRLDYANLRGAYLSSAAMLDASLQRVQLQGAHLEDANFRRARLIDVSVWRAIADHAVFDGATVIDPLTAPQIDPYIESAGFQDYSSKRKPKEFDFSLKGDARDTGWYDTTWGTSGRRFEQISPSKVKQLIAGASKEVRDVQLIAEIKKRLERMSPDYNPAQTSPAQLKQQDDDAHALWRRLASMTPSASGYEDALAKRLEHIACVGGVESPPGDMSFVAAPYVARGLLRAKRFDDTGCNRSRLIDLLRAAMKTGKKLDGADCAGAIGLSESDFPSDTASQEATSQKCTGSTKSRQ
ncbi:MAG: pentapeptide repeat-containing protein [Methylobacteriaceae bacterium]|nr:pentapeptide repeat-containing protein [Rhodoblastus sp.]MCC0005323.1 pentapeptide repeat-containing protein [Methylobacteriaceae bacterium]